MALTPTGFDSIVVAALGEDNSLTTMDTGSYLDTAAYGQCSDNVKSIQLALQRAGYWTNPNLKATGYFGEVTRLSLINFEKNYLRLTDGDISYVNGNYDSGYAYASIDTLSIGDTFKGIHKFIANKLDEIVNGRTITPLSITTNFFLGEADAVIDTAKGLWNCVQHPIRTGEGIVFLIRASQPGTPENVVMTIVIAQSFEQAKNDFIEADPNKKARIVGRIVGEIALCVVGTKGATAAMDAIKASAKSGKLGVWLGRIGRGVSTGDEVATGIKAVADAEMATNAEMATEIAETELSLVVRDISGLNNTAIFKPGALEHILEGETNSAGKAVGYHYEGFPTAKGRIIPGTETLSDSFGVYKAKIEINGVLKTSNGGYSTFFPKNWTPQQTVDAINHAFANKSFVPGTSNTNAGFTSNGIEIRMYIDSLNQIISAFPVYIP